MVNWGAPLKCVLTSPVVPVDLLGSSKDSVISSYLIGGVTIKETWTWLCTTTREHRRDYVWTRNVITVKELLYINEDTHKIFKNISSIYLRFDVLQQSVECRCEYIFFFYLTRNVIFLERCWKRKPLKDNKKIQLRRLLKYSIGKHGFIQWSTHREPTTLYLISNTWKLSKEIFKVSKLRSYQTI